MSKSKIRVLFIGKRFYTNRDALLEKYGRIYQLPYYWAHCGITTKLWLIDYHSSETVRCADDQLPIESLPIASIGTLANCASNLITGNIYTHVVATGDCYIGLLGAAIAKRAKARFIFDIYDKYDEFSGYGSLPGFDPFTFLLQHAHQRLFASQSLMEKIGGNEATDFMVPNGLDITRFRPLDKNECRQQLGFPESAKYIGYFGGMEPDRGVTDLINAVQKLREEGLAIELVLGGKPTAAIDITDPGIKYMGNIPFRDMPCTLGACDLLAVPYRRSAFMDAGASNKIAESLAIQRPIVATRTPNLLANFPEAASLLEGRLAEPGDAPDLARVIRLQLMDPKTAWLPSGWDWPGIAQRTATALALQS